MMTACTLQLHNSMLGLIAQRREQTGDPRVGAAIERCIIDQHLRALEEEICANPGALERLLVPVRRHSTEGAGV